MFGQFVALCLIGLVVLPPLLNEEGYQSSKSKSTKTTHRVRGNFSNTPTHYQPNRRNQSNLERPTQSIDNLSDGELVNLAAQKYGIESPTLIYDCAKSEASYAERANKLIAICNRGIQTKAYKRFAIFHEVAHLADNSESNREQNADRMALNALHNMGDTEAVQSVQTRDNSDPRYAQGARYSRQLLNN